MDGNNTVLSEISYDIIRDIEITAFNAEDNSIPYPTVISLIIKNNIWQSGTKARLKLSDGKTYFGQYTFRIVKKADGSIILADNNFEILYT